MVISGVVISSRPEHLQTVTSQVEALEWAEVHHSEPSGRCVVSVEAKDIEQSMARVRELQDLPRVASAQLAQYWEGEEAS